MPLSPRCSATLSGSRSPLHRRAALVHQSADEIGQIVRQQVGIQMTRLQWSPSAQTWMEALWWVARHSTAA